VAHAFILKKMAKELEKMTAKELIAVIAKKDKEIEAKTAVIASQDIVITELMDVNTKMGTPAAASNTDKVEVDGVTYSIMLKSFIHDGKRYTAADVAGNPIVAKKIVESKSPALKRD
jgi:hypothetical protein